MSICILDRDYHCQEEIEDRMKEADTYGICLHIWEKKEIENYLISQSAFYRLLVKNSKTRTPISFDEIGNKIDEIAESMKTDVIDKYAEEIQSKNKKWSISRINQEARQIVALKWENKLDIISGKEFLNHFNNWCMEKYRTSLTINGLSIEYRKEEIPLEMINVVSAIENNSKIK